MKTTFTTDSIHAITGRLREANTAINILYPGDSPARQPVHTVYGGAQIFKSDTAKKLGATALKTMQEYAPNAAAFRKAYEEVTAQLQGLRTPLERDAAKAFDGLAEAARRVGPLAGDPRQGFIELARRILKPSGDATAGDAESPGPRFLIVP